MDPIEAKRRKLEEQAAKRKGASGRQDKPLSNTLHSSAGPPPVPSADPLEAERLKLELERAKIELARVELERERMRARSSPGPAPWELADPKTAVRFEYEHKIGEDESHRRVLVYVAIAVIVFFVVAARGC